MPAAVPVKVALENAPVTPAGKPETESATFELNPFDGDVDRVSCAVPPEIALTEVALAENVKVGVGITTETVWVAVLPPPVPVTVSV